MRLNRVSRDAEASMIQRNAREFNCSTRMQQMIYWRKIRLGLLMMVLSWAASVGVGFYLNRDIVWDKPTVIGILQKYLLIGTLIGLSLFLILRMARAYLTLKSFVRSSIRERSYILKSQTPLEKLQEEFEAAFPGRLKNEEPPEPVFRPPQDDNPYSYR